ncbi:glycerophosphodiester phosphodiesterase family protein [Enterococcus pseudoavium]|uniref:Glycerophosphodiester phosphodiesterase family protein n=1 Tax=Enterococcus pseudoavium TaxID=44007 RepID=A0AAE4HYR6_9ENTE|nr:glycerophosphodiester phosphodiesterase family protein [Enterococcus pseudoavium]MDT2735773.1 glycerophosphodiester phosphodiesterase family protein [Enterococcus pseudoavium]
MKNIKSVLLIFLLSFTLGGCQFHGWGWLENDSTILSAHRGAHTVAPENTLESIKEAAKLQYKIIEIDPRESKDGAIYLMHDDTVNRTTNGTGKIENLTSNQINKLEISTSQYPNLKTKKIKVPTFESAVKEASKDGLIINVDGSKANWSGKTFSKKIVDVLKHNKVFEKSFFVISNKDQRDSFNEQYPEACISWLVDDSSEITDEIDLAAKYKHVLLSISNKYATKEHIAKLNREGIYYQVYGVNDSKRLQELKGMQVKMVETDTLVP